MFPLAFPYSILKRHALPNELVFDPFCGRGTTNFAGRMCGLPTIGIDSSPVAVAMSKAKLANTTPDDIVRAAKRILYDIPVPSRTPRGEFWELAFEKSVLKTLCRLRQGLEVNCRSHSRQALRGIILGALHGPRPKTRLSYFSNQSPRTFSPKPSYAVKFWKKHKLFPEKVNVLDLIEERAKRYYQKDLAKSDGMIALGDSRVERLVELLVGDRRVNWIITSPPYYGMRTYIPDQWLRMWFVGGSDSVDYSNENQLPHSSPTTFSAELKKVWQNAASVCSKKARMVIRFGGIPNRSASPSEIIEDSLTCSGWKVMTTKPAGRPESARRQANHFSMGIHEALEERDIWVARV